MSYALALLSSYLNLSLPIPWKSDTCMIEPKTPMKIGAISTPNMTGGLDENVKNLLTSNLYCFVNGTFLVSPISENRRRLVEKKASFSYLLRI